MTGSTVPSSAQRGRPRNPETEARIRRCAIDLLLERGIDKTTVEDIADRARVGKAAIYRRWASKTELAEDAMRELFDVDPPDPDTGSLDGDFREVYRRMLELAAAPHGLALIRLALGEANRDPQASVAAVMSRRLLRRQADRVAAAFERAGRRGETVGDDADPRLVAEWLASVLIVRAITGEPMPDPDQADPLARLTLRISGR